MGAHRRDSEFAPTCVKIRGAVIGDPVPELMELSHDSWEAKAARFELRRKTGFFKFSRDELLGCSLESLPHRIRRALQRALFIEDHVNGHLRQEIGHFFLVL